MAGTLRVARWLPRSSVNGPGERFVVWVQGCTLRCPGCWNPDTWSARGGRAVGIDELVALYRATPGVEGLTVSGGEPFQQAAAVAELAEAIRALGGSVMLFTGYPLDALVTPAHRRLLAAADLVVAGPYERARATRDAGWIASSNQRLHALTDRYPADVMPRSPGFEIHVGSDGGLVVTGFPPEDWRVEPARGEAPG